MPIQSIYLLELTCISSISWYKDVKQNPRYSVSYMLLTKLLFQGCKTTLTFQGSISLSILSLGLHTGGMSTCLFAGKIVVIGQECLLWDVMWLSPNRCKGNLYIINIANGTNSYKYFRILYFHYIIINCLMLWGWFPIHTNSAVMCFLCNSKS